MTLFFRVKRASQEKKREEGKSVLPLRKISALEKSEDSMPQGLGITLPSALIQCTSYLLSILGRVRYIISFSSSIHLKSSKVHYELLVKA